MIDYINFAYSEEVTYWGKAAIESIFNQERRKKINRFNTSKVSLIWKIKIVKTMHLWNFYLKSNYLAHNEEPRVFNNILSEEPYFEVMTDYLKAFSKIY